MDNIDISQSQEIYTVSQLNREVKLILEGSFASLWLQGEISNFSAPSSGHWYFSLKDATAQVKCAMFRPQNRRLNFLPKDGAHVLVKARVSLYEGRGDFQLLIEQLEDIGEGRLRQEFEALKKRLATAGLFDAKHKKLLPAFPSTIGVITSPTGAAIRDILSVLKRRYCAAKIIIYPTLVQGDTAAPSIVRAIETAGRRKECDVLILARGGGSLEDLWPFNDERVAVAIHHCTIPLVSGVGHEIDFTIADFVADVRAPTPSAAAELSTPDTTELVATLAHQQKQLMRSIKQKLQHLQQTITWSTKHLKQHHPKRRLMEQTQQLDFYETTLIRLQQNFLRIHQTKLSTLHAKLTGLTPTHQIQRLGHQLNLSAQRLQQYMQDTLLKKQQMLMNQGAKLDALSPLSTLKRGFAIATIDHNNSILRTADQVKVGDKIHVQLSQGKIGCTVDA